MRNMRNIPYTPCLDHISEAIMDTWLSTGSGVVNAAAQGLLLAVGAASERRDGKLRAKKPLDPPSQQLPREADTTV